MIINSLKIGLLHRVPNNILLYYRKHYNFQYFDTDWCKNVPITKLTTMSIEDYCKEEPFPYDEYAKGFVEEYKKELKKPFVISEETEREKLLSILNSVPSLPLKFERKSPNAKIDNDKVFELGKRIAFIYKAWEQILETPQYFSNYPPFKKDEKTPDYASLVNSLIDADFITRDLKECFTELLTTKTLSKEYDWDKTDWMLYVILDEFVLKGLLNIEQKKINEFILIHFKYKNKKFDKKNLRDSIKRAKPEQKCKLYTTKLKKLLQTYSN